MQYKKRLVFLFLFYASSLFAYYDLVSSISPKNKNNVVWSILICTLDERHDTFTRIYKKLLSQIGQAGLCDEVEIIYCKDQREYSIGFKRNQLLQASKGKYINYIDDDDDISNNYISMIYNKLQNDPDCVSLVGVITFDGQNPRTFIHSIKYDSYFEENNVYYRPPNHLNIIRRSIGIQFAFPEINHGEDTDWAMQIARSGLLKQEEQVDEPYYFYLFTSK